MKHSYRRFKNWFLRPEFMRKFNGWAAIFFAVLIIPSIAFGWLEIVAFVSILSIWALVASHWAAYQGAKVEEKEDLAQATRPRAPRIKSGKIPTARQLKPNSATAKKR